MTRSAVRYTCCACAAYTVVSAAPVALDEPFDQRRLVRARAVDPRPVLPVLRLHDDAEFAADDRTDGRPE